MKSVNYTGQSGDRYLVFADFLLFCELVKLSIGRAVQQPDELDKSEEALHAQLINSMPC